jgi:hypothetical protein
MQLASIVGVGAVSNVCVACAVWHGNEAPLCERVLTLRQRVEDPELERLCIVGGGGQKRRKKKKTKEKRKKKKDILEHD